MKKHLAPVLTILLAATFLASSLLKPGFMATHDGIWHVRRIYEMFTMLREGYFPVRWGLTLDNFFGIPIFNFLYPLPYLLAAIPQYLGFGLLTANNLVYLFAYILGGLGIYALLAGKKTRFFALIAALLYLMVPYQFLDIFVRGALGETLALGIIPWTMLAVKHQQQAKHLLWYSPIPLALLLLAHNFLGAIFLGLLAGYLFFFRTNWQKIVLQILLALGLSAFFVVPMLSERSLLLSVSNNDFTFVPEDHLVYPRQLIYSPWSYLYSFPGESELDMSFQLGIANLIIIGLALLAYRSSRSLRLLFLLTLLSIFMMLPYSRYLWANLDPLKVLQFPWRLLAITSVATPLLYFLVARSLSRHFRFISILLSLFLVLVALYNVRNYRRPVQFLDHESFMTQYNLFIDKTASAIRSEFTPKWAKDERYAPENNGRWPTKSIGIFEGPTRLELVHEEPGKIIISTNAENERARVIIYRNYFPSWEGYDEEGGVVSLEPAPDGSIIFAPEVGEHTYTITLGSTPLETASNWLSVFSLLLVGMIALKPRFFR